MSEPVVAPAAKPTAKAWVIFTIILAIAIGGAFFFSAWGSSLQQFAKDVVIYSNRDVKNALFTLWGTFTGILGTIVILAAIVVGFIAKAKASK